MKKTIFIVLIAVIFCSCKKDPPIVEPKSCAISTDAIAGPYKITAATYKETPTSAEIDYIPVIFSEPCRRDDVYTFKTDGTYQIADVGSVCSPAGDYTGTWSYAANIMEIDGDPVNAESFDCKTMVLVNTDINVAGDRLKLTMTRQ